MRAALCLSVLLTAATAAAQPPLLYPTLPRMEYAEPAVLAYPPADTVLLSPVIHTLRRDTRFCDQHKPTRPSELVPVLPMSPILPPPQPTRPQPQPVPVQPQPVPTQPQPRPQPQPQPMQCCDELIARLKALDVKIENIKATAELDPESVDALAEAVAEKLKLPDLGNLATKDDIKVLLARFDGLATKDDVQKIAVTQTTVVTILEKLVDMPTKPPGNDPPDANSLRELALLVQRQAGALASLSNNVELLSKNVVAQGDKLKNIELAVQTHTGELAKLVRGLDGINKTVGALDPRLDNIEIKLRELALRLQRLEGTSTALSPGEKQQRIDEMVLALREVLGGKIRLRLRFDPQTGEILGADPIQ